MRPIRTIFSANAMRIGLNTALTQEDLLKLKKEVVAAVVPALRGRQLLPMMKDLDISQEFINFYAEIPPGEAIVGGRRTSSYTEDEVREEIQTAIPVQMLRRPFRVHRLDMAAKQGAKERNAKAAARRCYEAENDMIYNGATYPTVSGLIAKAGNSQAAASVWSAAPGTATPYEDVNNLIALMEADGFTGPFSLAVDPINLGELRKREVVAGGSAKSYLSLILESLVGEVIGDPSQTHGTPVVIQKEEDVAQLGCPEDLTIEFFDMDENHWIKGQTYLRSVPIVWQANGVGKITGA